ncbi:MAG: hypothetical protein PVH61_03340 [Candidatus Aminicenantes bacterium]|jgi:hypothetical protein
MTFSIEVENRFEMNRRDIQVCRKNRGEIREEHRISCPVSESGEDEGKRSFISLPLEAVDEEEDFLEISVDNQQVDLGPCKVVLWSDISFTFTPPGTANITLLPSKEWETNTSIKIPSGLPTWKLEIKPTVSRADDTGTINVTVEDDAPGGWD